MRAAIMIPIMLAYGCHGAAGHGARVGPRTAAVMAGVVVDRVLVTGALHAVSALDLVVPSTDQSQLSIRWMIADGAQVKAGDEVLAFDSSAFTSKLLESHAQLRQAEAQFRLFQDACKLHVAEKKLDVRKQHNSLAKALLQAEMPADLMTERTRWANKLALAQAEANVAKAESELATMIADNALEERIQQIDLDKTRRTIAAAEYAIEALVVKAPRDGVVVVDNSAWDGHKFHVGDLVQDGTPIVSLPDLTKPMEVRADLIDVDDGRASLDVTGSCTLDAYPADPLPCTVEALAPVARVKEGQGSLRRTFSVTLVLGGGGGGDRSRLRPGMAVKVELPRPAVHGLVVPRGAVALERGPLGTHARVQLAGGALRDVTLAGCDEQRCAITAGVSEGDAVSIDWLGDWLGDWRGDRLGDRLGSPGGPS